MKLTQIEDAIYEIEFTHTLRISKRDLGEKPVERQARILVEMAQAFGEAEAVKALIPLLQDFQKKRFDELMEQANAFQRPL